VDTPDDIADLTVDWPVDTVAVGVTDETHTLALGGDTRWTTPVASVTKLFVAYAGLVALEEGSLTLDGAAGDREGSTVRHLLAHATGLPFDGDEPVAAVGTRRVYSNTGIERFADHLAERTGITWVDYVREAVLAPLGMDRTELRGSPAHGAHSCVRDLLAFGRELLSPTLIGASTLVTATTPQFADLRGAVPGVGRFDPCPWGLGFEIVGDKTPHWTGATNSPTTFGHFGGAGTFLWVDPDAGLACAALTDLGFGAWSLDLWPRFSDAVLARYR
jgi:CubicO group peptidase (beta-lactamase class C family)